MIKGVWELVKRDFVEHGLSYSQLMKKYEIKGRATIANHSKKEGWLELREKHKQGVELEVIERDDKRKDEKVKEKESLIEALEVLIDLKIGAEKKALLKTVDTQDLKLILSILKSVKTPLPELIRVFELLKGNPDARLALGFQDDEKTVEARHNRMDVLGLN